MKAAERQNELLDKINRLTEHQKKKIETGIKQASAGQGKPLKEVVIRLRKKYGIQV